MPAVPDLVSVSSWGGNFWTARRGIGASVIRQLNDQRLLGGPDPAGQMVTHIVFWRL